MLKCPLCGCKFDLEASVQVCGGCPLSKGCKLVKCPNCGYEFPKPRSTSGLLGLLRRIGLRRG